MGGGEIKRERKGGGRKEKAGRKDGGKEEGMARGGVGRKQVRKELMQTERNIEIKGKFMIETKIKNGNSKQKKKEKINEVRKKENTGRKEGVKEMRRAS